MKTCKRCGRVKLTTLFFADRSQRDGLNTYCKECRGQYSREYHRLNRGKKVKYDAERYPVIRVAKIQREVARTKLSRLTNPEWMRLLHRANMAVSRAVKTGRLRRPTACEACGNADGPIEAAHQDYVRPYLNIRWLCRPCHRRDDRANPKCHEHDRGSSAA